jgi:hypothetical protein
LYEYPTVPYTIETRLKLTKTLFKFDAVPEQDQDYIGTSTFQCPESVLISFTQKTLLARLAGRNFEILVYG